MAADAAPSEVEEGKTRPLKIVQPAWQDSRKGTELPLHTQGESGFLSRRKRRTCCRCCCSLKSSGEALRAWLAFRLWRDWLQGDGRGQLVSLLAAAGALIGAGMVVWSAIGGDQNANANWDQSLWMSWGLFFDPGTQTGVSADAPVKVKATALIFSVLGFLYNLTFLGIIVEWIRSSMDHWTKTKSRIWYGNHILILGWSEKTLYLLNELFEALCSNGDTVPVVILADREQSLMQQEVQQHFYQLWERNSFFDRRWRLLKSVMLREGVAHETDALERAGASMAQEIIILSRDGNPRIADLETVRIMLALSSLREPARCRIFAEAQAHEVETVLRRLHPDPKAGIQVIQARAACNHILALLASDQMVGGLLADLCSFAAGDELYVISPWAPWTTFGQARKDCEPAMCIGVQVLDPEKPGGTRLDLAPDDSSPLTADDKLLVMASSLQDLEAYTQALFHWRNVRPGFMTSLLGGRSSTEELESASRSKAEEASEHKVFVVIGWPADFADVLALLDDHVPEGTKVHVLSERSLDQRKALGAGRKLTNIELEHHYGDRTSREMIQKLPLKQAVRDGAVVVLAQLHDQSQDDLGEALEDDEVGDDTLTSDSACLASLLVMSDILGADLEPGTPRKRQAYELSGGTVSAFQRMSERKTNVICEVLDPRTERVVARNPNLQEFFFFRSKALETGLFMMAMSEPTVFHALLKLMSPDFPSLQAKKVWRFWEDKDTGAACASSPAKSPSYLGEKSWNELSEAVRRQRGLLVGWKRRHEVCRIKPPISQDKPERWYSNDTLMVILPKEESRALS